MYLCAAALSLFWVAAWQVPPTVSLTVEVEPDVAVRGETLTLTFMIANSNDAPLEEAVLRVRLPDGTTLERAETVGTEWLQVGPVDGAAAYRGTLTLEPGQSAALTIVVRVDEAAGETLAVDDYTLDAAELDTLVVGEPLSIPVEAGASPPTATPTVAVTATVTMTVTPLPSPSFSPTPQPTETETAAPTRTPTPTPTITLAPVEMPVEGTPTPTPNLSSEQVRVGTVTVLVFVGLAVVLLVFTVAWAVRTRRER
jgi:hypothetical protein